MREKKWTIAKSYACSVNTLKLAAEKMKFIKKLDDRAHFSQKNRTRNSTLRCRFLLFAKNAKMFESRGPYFSDTFSDHAIDGEE